MKAKDLQKPLNWLHFQPFRVRTSSGSVYRVLDPSWMSVTVDEA
jgi:hypothetical protein